MSEYQYPDPIEDNELPTVEVPVKDFSGLMRRQSEGEASDITLRKYALELATELVSDNFVPLAKEFYEFLSPAPVAVAPEKSSKELIQVDPNAIYAVRPHELKPLFPMQRMILRTIIELYRTEGKVNGTDVGKAAKMGTPTGANAYVKQLQKLGYVRRNGWDVIPLFTPEKEPVGPVVQKLPDGVARGYRPLTAKLGDVGRVPS